MEALSRQRNDPIIKTLRKGDPVFNSTSLTPPPPLPSLLGLESLRNVSSGDERGETAVGYRRANSSAFLPSPSPPPPLFAPALLVRLINRYSRIPVTRTLYNSNLPLTRNNLHFPSDRFLHNFILDNSYFFLFPLKVRIIRSRLYFYLAVQKSCKRSGFYISYFTLIP